MFFVLFEQRVACIQVLLQVPVAQFVHPHIHFAHITGVSEVRHSAFVQHTKNFMDFSDRHIRVCVHQSCDFVRVHRSRATRSLRVFSTKVSNMETRKSFLDTFF